MNFGIAFAPLVPAYILWAATVVAVIISAVLLFIGSRGALLRATAMALLIFALANPSFTREDREPLATLRAPTLVVKGRCDYLSWSSAVAYLEAIPTHWLVYFWVEDTDATLEQVRASGGNVAMGPVDIPAGRFGVAMDPQGAAFGVIKGSEER